MEISITKVASDRMKPKPTDESKLGFGKHSTAGWDGTILK